jgi:hypothetical protein
VPAAPVCDTPSFCPSTGSTLNTFQRSGRSRIARSFMSSPAFTLQTTVLSLTLKLVRLAVLARASALAKCLLAHAKAPLQGCTDHVTRMHARARVCTVPHFARMRRGCGGEEGACCWTPAA